MDEYDELAPIAKSYYGELTLCVDPKGHVVMARRVAVGTDADADARRRIVTSARKGRLHEHVVRLLNVLQKDGGITLVSAYVDGAPLSMLARLLSTVRQVPDSGVLVRIVLDALGGLEAMSNDEDYLPGGFTPDAVFVCADGRSRLVEPMVQSALGSLRSLARHQNRVAYRAPEQFDDRVSPDGRVDVFTFGVILFELLHRRRLFAGLGFDDIAKRVRTAQIPTLEGHGELEDVLLTALARDPRRRFESVGALRLALADVSRDATPQAVSALFEEQLGSHPSIVRVREAVRDAIAASKSGTRTRRLSAIVGPRPKHDTADDERPSTPSSLPADSVPPPPLPTADTLEKRGPVRQIGRGELFLEISSDDVAAVHVGRWLGAAGFARLIAVTMLRDEFASKPKLVAAYRDDARIISRVRHPNVVPIHDVIDDRGELLVVGDYVVGVTLAHLIRQVKRSGELIPIGVASRIVCDVLSGLQAAHVATDESGALSPVVHRDVCPSAVLVGEDGVARLVRFGLERGLAEAGKSRTGDVFYRAPEQLTGGAVDPRTDIYGASVLAFQALSGRLPYRGDQARQKILEGKPRAPSSTREGLPPDVEALVLRGMARAREARWTNAEEMAEALEDLPGTSSHRAVAEWVRKVAADRMERARRLSQAVESAAVMLTADELEDPLSVDTAPRESIADAMQLAADVFGGAHANASLPPGDPAGGSSSMAPVPSAPPLATPIRADGVGRTLVAAIPTKWRSVAAVGAAVSVGAVIGLIALMARDESSAPDAANEMDPAPSVVPSVEETAAEPEPSAREPDPEPSAAPSSSSPAGKASGSGRPSKQPWPTPKTSSSAPRRRLPHGI